MADFPEVLRFIEQSKNLPDLSFLDHLAELRRRQALGKDRYWLDDDYLFMAVVHTVIDLGRFTFVWRGRVLYARAFPDTSSLSRGDTVLIRKLPASSEYFTIIYGIPPVLIATAFTDTGRARFAYTLDINSTSPTWLENSVGLPPCDAVIHLFGDGATEYMILDDALSDPEDENSNQEWQVWRNIDPLGTGVWEKILGAEADLPGLTGDPNTTPSSLLLRAPAARVGGYVYFTVEGFDNTRDYLIYSRDEGNTWNSTILPPQSPSTNSNYYTMIVSLNNPDLLYISGAQISIDGSNVLLSIDGGLSFSLQAHLTPFFDAPFIGMHHTDNPNDSIVFLTSASVNSGPTARRSTDFGVTWSAWASTQHRPMFSRTNSQYMWNINGFARTWYRSFDQGLSYSPSSLIGMGGAGFVNNYGILDGYLYKTDLAIVVGVKARLSSPPFAVVGGTVYTSPDQITFTDRSGNIDSLLFSGLLATQRPRVEAMDMYTLAKQQVIFQG